MPKAGSKVLPEEDSAGEAKSLLLVARRVAATIGTDFFRATAKHLAEALTADCVLVGEFVGGHVERCRSLAAWLDGGPADFEFALAESATSQVVLGKERVWRSDVQTRFPSDSLLSAVGAQAYIGVPLLDGNRQPFGVLLALYRRPVVRVRVPRTLLEIFAERASAELTRKKEEDELRQCDQRHRAFIGQNADAMWRIEFDPPVPIDLPEQEQFDRIYASGYLAECNDALARLLGKERAEQLTGSTVEGILPASDPTVREATMVAIRAGFRHTTVETNPPDGHGGHKHFIRSQWGIVEQGKLERVWGATRDISELRHVEKALDASEQRMEDLIEAMRMLVLMLDANGTVSFCNNFLYRLTGWNSSDLLGHDWLEKMVPEDERNRLRTELARGSMHPDVPIHFESTVLSPDGRRRQFSWDSTVLHDASGKMTVRTIIGRDITEFKNLEEQFRKAQKLASIGKLAGGLAHDFNNLLTIISGYTVGLLEKLNSTDPIYTSLDEVRKASEKAAHLAHGLLTFSRRQALRPQVIQINSVVEEAEGMLRILLGDHIHLVTSLDRNASQVRVDGGYFHQVLINLAVNARDAMPHGGTLAIATSNVEIDAYSPYSISVPPNRYVQVTVADNGTGMTDEVREHLFEPFFTTKEVGKGTGLGLSTVYGIVLQSGGHILVDSEVGRGTTFRIYIPRIVEEPVPADSSEFRDLPSGTETILLLEARQDACSLSATLLKHLGYTVIQVDDPVRAVELSRNHSGSIDLLFIDTGVPNLKADELADLVKAARPGIKFLFVSSQGYSAISDTPSKARIAYLQKPFAALSLAQKVRELLDEK
jgi:two-component system, cell cycle sensor histidine kinase and response regulator CckA